MSCICCESGAHINDKWAETVHTVRKREHEAERYPIEGGKGCRPRGGAGEKKICDMLNITFSASSPKNFIHKQPQNTDFKNGQDTKMFLKCWGRPGYWNQLIDVVIATVQKDSTLPVDEQSNYPRRKWVYCAYSCEKYCNIGNRRCVLILHYVMLVVRTVSVLKLFSSCSALSLK